VIILFLLPACLVSKIETLTHQILFSSFSNTDLDYQLRQRDITKLVTAGMTCNQCLELTSRTAIELGYNVTVTWVHTQHRKTLAFR
jgi:nicotinamidase-related amidase